MYKSYKFKPFLAQYDASMNGTDDSVFPIIRDLTDYYNVTYQFVKAYVSLYYDTESSDRISDKEVSDFYVNLKRDLRVNEESESEEKTEEVRFSDDSMSSFIAFLTNLICECTAWHEHVGAAFDYFSIDPQFIDTKLYPHRLVQSKNDFAQLAVLVIFTGFRFPKLKNDWSRVLLDDAKREKGVRVLGDWQSNLQKLENEIEARNKKRRVPFMSCNPKVLECSVSI